MAQHKPSERFMRKPLKARSKASLSERARVADLEKKLGAQTPLNEPARFAGYKPGAEHSPGS